MFACHVDFIKVWHELVDEVADNDKNEDGLEYREHMARYQTNVKETIKRVMCYPRPGLYSLYMSVPEGTEVIGVKNMCNRSMGEMEYELELIYSCGKRLKAYALARSGRNHFQVTMKRFKDKPCNHAPLALRFCVKGPIPGDLDEKSPGVIVDYPPQEADTQEVTPAEEVPKQEPERTPEVKEEPELKPGVKEEPEVKPRVKEEPKQEPKVIVKEEEEEEPEFIVNKKKRAKLSRVGEEEEEEDEGVKKGAPLIGRISVETTV